MRRPVMYLAGLLLASGASLAIAGPAAAAVSHDSHKSHGNHWWLDDDECDEDYDSWYLRRYHRHHFHGGDNYNVNQRFNGISLLSGNVGGLL